MSKRNLTIARGLIVAAGLACLVPSGAKVDDKFVSERATGVADKYPLATENLKSCAALQVSSINVSAEYFKDDFPFDPAPSLSATPMAQGKLQIMAFGPALGSMDSTNLKIETKCTTKGAVLTAVIRRSANYRGAAVKNVLWHPKIRVVITLRRPEAVFQQIWRMRVTTGAELDRAQTSSYPSEKYPIILEKTIR